MARINSEFEVKSPFKDISYPVVGVWKFLTTSVADNLESEAVIDPVAKTALTYRELLECAESAAFCLYNDHGYSVASPLVLCMVNCPEFVIAALAAWKSGGTVALINPLLTSDEIKKQLHLLQANFLICCATTVNKCLTAIQGSTIKRIFATIECEGCILFSSLHHSMRRSNIEELHQFDPKLQTAIIPFSSGTTGMPKGVELTHCGVVEQTCYFRSNVLHDCKNGVVIYQPFSHMWGLEILLSFLSRSQKIIIMRRFHLEKYLQLVSYYQTEMLFLVPPIAVNLANSKNMAKYDLSHVKTIVSSAAPLSSDLEEKIKSQFAVSTPPKVTQALGMTELTCLAILVPSFPMQMQCPHGSVGWPNCSTKIKIVDPVSKSNLGPGEKGEICFKCNYMMKGYFNNIEATRQTIDADGWLHGGDIGYYDKNGCFFVVDRIKELIKYKAYQVAPAELESVLLSHPDVMDAGVTYLPDKEAGELPYAWVVKKNNSSLATADLQQFVNKRVASFKRLRGGITFVKEIPKSPSGKILRRVIREKSTLISKL